MLTFFFFKEKICAFLCERKSIFPSQKKKFLNSCNTGNPMV